MHNSRRPAISLALLITGVHCFPLLGVLLLGWSPIEVLLIYWVENIVTIRLWSKSLLEHSRVTRKRGHLGKDGSDLTWYSLSFYHGNMSLSVVHGLFVLFAALLTLVVDGWLRLERLQAAEIFSGSLPLGAAALIIALVTGHELKQRSAGIGARSFAWLDEHTRKVTWNVYGMHFGLMLGGLWLFLGGADRVASMGLFFAVPVIALRAWITYKRNRPFESLESRQPGFLEVGTSRLPAHHAQQWRQAMLEQARQREERVPLDF